DRNRSIEQQHSLAVEHLDRIEKTPDLSADLLAEVAQQYADIGLPDRSAAVFDRAEALAPDKMDIYLARGQIAMRAEEFGDGAAVAERALKASVGERRHDILPLAAECYARTGKVSEAREVIETLRA